jgi:molybdopterin-biosynthesis enzyme MoeA-like protein
MAEWVLETLYHPQQSAIQETSLRIVDTPESTLVPLMEAFQDRFPGLKLYSLPRLGKPPVIELGLRGRGDMAAALNALMQALDKAEIPFRQENDKQ